MKGCNSEDKKGGVMTECNLEHKKGEQPFSSLTHHSNVIHTAVYFQTFRKVT